LSQSFQIIQIEKFGKELKPYVKTPSFVLNKEMKRATMETLSFIP
jgi:hypothetical protein